MVDEGAHLPGRYISLYLLNRYLLRAQSVNCNILLAGDKVVIKANTKLWPPRVFILLRESGRKTKNKKQILPIYLSVQGGSARSARKAFLRRGLLSKSCRK